MSVSIIQKNIWGKYALGLGILSIAVFMLFSALETTCWGAGWLIGVHFLEGIGEGSTFPALKLHKNQT
jgi:hypothetical protein